MGNKVNGARSILNLLAQACKMSHLPGFRLGLNRILGADVVVEFYAVWTPLCEFVDNLVALDNWYNQKDYQDDDTTGEDTTAPVIG